MNLRERASQIAVALAVLCAVISTVVTIRREFFDRQITLSTIDPRKPVSVPNWQRYVTGGHRLGPANATLTIVEFADFECPYCRQFALGQLRYVRALHPDIAILVRQRPMPYHRFAYPAARAAECAATQGRYEQYHDALFVGQDSLGLKSFADFARLAAVPDLHAFAVCDSSSSRVAIVDADVAAADSVGVRATPSLIINGQLITGAPDSAHFERYIVDALRDSRTVAGKASGH